ncbi:hypothetical protein Spla01_02289 [Streptomyces platensis]|uniref:Uncharacterized protein n=1 Tax=Streptomyces platensis TaxID=58346 RepID=A0ABX3Y137_STRPT|nr:hypothetical protein [Streptomyces platensis]OSY46513.1 hypothetical protein BG653_01880 [Streptomyces platensis]
MRGRTDGTECRRLGGDGMTDGTHMFGPVLGDVAKQVYGRAERG